MNVTSFDNVYISSEFPKLANKKVLFGFKDIVNFIIVEVNMFTSEIRLNESNQTPINAINLQIIALVAITVIFMLLMDVVFYFDK